MRNRKNNPPCHKEGGCHQTPSACPEPPDPSWFYVEAYLFKKNNKIPSTFTHLPISWKVETDHGLLVTFKLSSQIRSLVSANWAQIRDNVLIIVWSVATANYLFLKRSHLLLSSRRFCWGLWSDTVHEKGWCSSSYGGKSSISLNKKHPIYHQFLIVSHSWSQCIENKHTNRCSKFPEMLIPSRPHLCGL